MSCHATPDPLTLNIGSDSCTLRLVLFLDYRSFGLAFASATHRRAAAAVFWNQFSALGDARPARHPEERGYAMRHLDSAER
ncbi:hypothetical protein QF035_000301 [Streptomyces umbrinus]|uniref:Uncharacterized protein n=1 Tax=Streptomyces umbrinus TaxID=67370 RepID=A0ABU0SJQ7_9ACTN|nr:hypothetical protein [Streptomyces umbrinus]MDQ1022719.1 hypothetical protein [Streptomyces umbrinus]